MTQSYRMTLVTLLGLALLSSPALAFEKDHGKGHDRDDRKESRDHDRDRDRHHAGHDRDRDRDGDRDGRPPGWSHGRKEGWKATAVAPGSASVIPTTPASATILGSDLTISLERDQTAPYNSAYSMVEFKL